ncbi:hypothetical protein TrVGV298_000015 [Trichoderma virens]|nr:hypothetical protein TrVGV298_000015 [Trichoderma virens]
MAASSTGIAKIKATLEALNQHIREATETIASEELAPVLDGALHSVDTFPDRDLDQLARTAVDLMDALQLRLVPSVMLLADGFFGYLNSKAMAAVVEAKVPDVLESHGPLTAEKLGPLVQVQPTRLAQLLDTLVNNGIFSYDASSGTFSNNRCSTLLRRDHWTKWHLWADLYPNIFFDVSRSIPQAIRLGETRNAAQIEYKTDMSLFDYMAKQGKSEQFHNTLGAGAVAMAKGLTLDYPWGELGGETLHVVDLISPDFKAGDGSGRHADVASRMSLRAGDFFGDIPAASVYTIKWCLHNWMDEDVVRILSNARSHLVASPVARFVIFESIKRPLRSGRLPRYGDLVMMITVNGKERSEQDWTRLAGLAGWTVHRIIDIRNSWVSAIELRPA